MASEGSISAAIIRWIRDQPDGYAVKVWQGGMAGKGQPDISGSIAGRCLKLETKRPGHDATPLQDSILRKWRAAGAIAGVVRSVDDVVALLAEHGLERQR